MKFEKVHYPRIWAELLDEAERSLELTPRHKWRGGTEVESMLRALGAYKLLCFCERYRTLHSSTWNDLPDETPARIYLMNKHHWTLSEVKALKKDELLLALHEELVDMKLNPVEAAPVREWGNGFGKFSLLEPHLEPFPNSD